MKSKCETRYSCYSHPEKDNSIIFIMEEILSQSMMSVMIFGRLNIAKVFDTVCNGILSYLSRSDG